MLKRNEERHPLTRSVGDLVTIEIWAEYVSFYTIACQIHNANGSANIENSLEENLGIVIASLPACRRLFIMGLSSIRKRNNLSRVAPSNIQNTIVTRRTDPSNQHENDVDNLVPLSDIQVTNSLEIQYATRTPSFHEIERGYDTPGEWKNMASVGQTAIESI